MQFIDSYYTARNLDQSWYQEYFIISRFHGNLFC